MPTDVDIDELLDTIAFHARVVLHVVPLLGDGRVRVGTYLGCMEVLQALPRLGDGLERTESAK